MTRFNIEDPEALAALAYDQSRGLKAAIDKAVALAEWLSVPSRCQMPECRTLLGAEDGDWVRAEVEGEGLIYMCGQCHLKETDRYLDAKYE